MCRRCAGFGAENGHTTPALLTKGRVSAGRRPYFNQSQAWALDAAQVAAANP
jgi:hypothetical protein